ncbi:hypothetical protein [Mycobacterium sp. KBS0706]|uniref:hypothetical protein n=1 Tax=Mycobacterium sp. KBS0706 TaxID=2578109 RepID=UPI00163D4AF6|nr:hypothetical protein [Mycobacterium sp. KBS0706]
MTAEPIPAATPTQARPDHIKRGLIVLGIFLVIVVVAVAVQMALRTPKQFATDQATKPEAPAPDPQNTFLQQLEANKPKDASPAPSVAPTPVLAQGEVDAMQELRKSMSVKSAPARSQPSAAGASQASAPIAQQRAEDLDQQIQDLNRRLEEGQRK